MSEKREGQGTTSATSNASTQKGSQPFQFPGTTFSTFIASLNATALVHLGVMNTPGTNESSKNLAVAKQTIDIIGMLEVKTRGNLTEDEAKLIQNILHDLRLMYVKEV